MTDQQRSQRTMVFSRRGRKKSPDKPFEPPEILPIATMDDFEAQVDTLLATYLHNVNTQSFHSQVTKLVQQCPKSIAVITGKTISSFKILSQVHGLPHVMAPHLLAPLSDPSAGVQFRLKIAHTLKYCQEKSKKYVEGAQVLRALEVYEKNLGESSPSFLERNLLSSLFQIVACVAEQYDDATMALLKRSYGMLNAEQKMDVRNLMESKGLWDASLHPEGDASVSFISSEMSEDLDEMTFLSKNLKRSNVTTVTKDQQIDTVISEESEKTEMLSFNIQCTPWTTQEETSSFNVRLETSDTPQLLRSNRNSSFWETLDRTLSWSSNKVDQYYQKAQADQTSLTLEELEYLVDTFYSSTFCKNDEPEMDRKIVGALKLISTCVQLSEELLKNLLSKALQMCMGDRKAYDQSLTDQLLEGVLEVTGNQCVMLNAEEFYQISFRLESIDQQLQNSPREVHGRLRDKIWTIFQHQASEEEMQRIVKHALDLLMDKQPHAAALDFIVTRVRTGKMLTIEDRVVPAAINVLNSVKYSQDQRRSAFRIVELHNSNPQAPLLTSEQIKTTLENLEDCARVAIPAFILRYLNKMPHAFYVHGLMNTIWVVLNSCTEHLYLDGDMQNIAHLLLAIEKMASLTSEYRVNNEWSSRETLPVRNLEKIAEYLRVKAMIYEDGSVCDVTEQHSDQPHTLFSIIVAKILVDLCSESTFSTKILEEVTQTLNNDDDDKMTRIYCSEYLFKVRTFHEFSPQDREILQKCTQDPITDIQIYSRVAYTHSLKDMNVIPAHHVYHLPSVYAFAPVRFGCDDFTDEINNNILAAFEHVRATVEFNVEMYKVLSHALDEMLQNPSDKLDDIRRILRTVAGSLRNVDIMKHNMSGDLLDIIVNLVEKMFIKLEDFNDDCCRLMVKLLGEGQWISPAIAKKCVEITRNVDVANDYIDCLWMATELQDLPRRIFNDFQVELVGKRFSNVEKLPELNDHEEALKFLHKALESGHCLSEYNMEVIKDLFSTDTLTELALDCLISACFNGQHINSDLLDVAFHAACSKKKLKLAKILVQRHEQLPEEYKTTLFDKDFQCLSAAHDWPLLDLVVTMIQYNYWIPRFVINVFDSIAMAAIQTVGNPQMLPTDLVIPALACLIDRRLIYETRLPKWRDELLQYARRSPSNLDLALDVIMKLPWQPPIALISNFDIDELIIQALNPFASQSSRYKMYKAQRGSSLHKVLLLFSKHDDIDDLTSAICLYIANEIQLELPQHVCCRLEDSMLSSSDVSFQIFDHLRALPKESPKHQLKKIANVAFLVQLSATDDEIRENCDRIIKILGEFDVKSEFAMNRQPETIEDDSEDEGCVEQMHFSTVNNSAVESTWEVLSEWEDKPIDLSNLSKIAKQVTKNSRSYSPSQIQKFVQFSLEASTGKEPTMELINMWYHCLRYGTSADVRTIAFSALATARKQQGSEMAHFIDQNLWDHIVKDKIRLLYKDIQGNEVHISDHEFYTQLAHTLYSLDHWDFKQLKGFPNPDDWIPQLIISDLIERFATNNKERAELYVSIKKFVEAGGDINSLKTFVCLNASAAAKDFKMSYSTLIKLCSDCLRLTGEFKEQPLRPLIHLALCEQINAKFLQAPPSRMTAFLVEQLLETAYGNYNVASSLISAIHLIQRRQELFQIIQVFREITSAQQEKFLDSLKFSERTHSASELRAAILTANLMHILNIDVTSVRASSMERKLLHLFKREFSPEPLLKLFNAGREQKIPFDVIENIVHQLHQYNVDCQTCASQLAHVSNSNTTESITLQISKFIQSQIHSDSLCERVRHRDQLLRELRDPSRNPNANLSDMLESFMDDLHGDMTDYLHVRRWSRDQISRWACAQQGCYYTSTSEQVAVICRAFKIYKDWTLTEVQVLSILIALEKSSNCVQLQQVSTGTGKSAIIAAVAVLKALDRQKVDIYTSSPVLAERDAKEWTPFYALFGLTCSHNVEKGGGASLKGSKKCYESDIVYGDMSQFQFDALKTFYSGLETLGDRQFEFALVDEVDSMCIDDSSKLARLSSTLPGMDRLHVVYQEIWHHLRLIDSRMSRIDGKVYFIDSEEETEEVEDLEKFVKKKLVDFINDFILNPTEGFKLKLSQHMRNYAKIQAENWADSAITALEFKENEDYIVDGGKIKPVDFKTTGVVQSLTNWNNGLHPFLQIKHSLRVTPETITTNFMSNREILSRYGNNVIGFTGTLGSETSKEVLQHAYNAESIIIPEMYFKRFYQLGDIVAADKADWTNHIVYNALHEASKKRGVLVICQTIKEARKIANEIRRANIMAPNPDINLSVYVRNDHAEENRVERVHPGTIIVATNLGTRGMDLKASDVEEYGGLHVILTYLPDSLRVEKQAFGRTSRQGNRGTGQLIVTGIPFGVGTKNDISNIRDISEGERLISFVTDDLPLITLKDKLFTKFCTRYSEIRDSLRLESLLPSWTTKLRRMTGFDPLSQHDYAVLQAIEERWALFLKKIEDDARRLDGTRTDNFQEFEEKVLDDYRTLEGTVLKNYRDLDATFGSVENCYYWIRCGNEFYLRDGKFSQGAAQAIEYFDRAAQYDGPVAPALVGEAVSRLKSSHTWQHKEESLKNLENAQRILDQEIRQYRRCQALQLSRPGCAHSDLHKQLENKIQFVNSYLFNVEKMIDVVSKSLRRVYVDMSTLEGESFTTIVQPGTGIPGWGRPASNTYGLKFHDLTMRRDINTIDQAINTIDEACSYDNNCPSVSFIIKRGPEFQLEDFQDNLNDLEIFFSKRADVSGIEYVHRCTRAESMTFKVSGTPAVVSKALSLPILANKNVELSSESQEEDGRWCKSSKKFTADDRNDLNLNLNCRKCTVSVDVSLTDRGLEDLFTIPDLSSSIEISLIDIELLNAGRWNSLLNRFDEISLTLKTSDQSQAHSIVRKLRQQKINFVLEFRGLNYGHAKHLWEKCDCSQELIEQLSLDLMSKRLPDSDLGPMISRGMELLPQLVERNFVPWKSLMAMGAIGGAQIALGLALVSTGIGSQAGLAFTREGIVDLVMAALDGRDFELIEYGNRKATSFPHAAMTLGSGFFSGKNASTLLTMTTKEAIRRVATTVALKQLDQAYISLKKFSLEQIRQHLFLKVLESVRWQVQDMCEDLARFFGLGSMRKTNQHLRKLKNWISKIPNSNLKIIMDCISISQQICNALQSFCASEHLENGVTCFKLMSVAMKTIGRITVTTGAVKATCEYVHSCIKREISQLSVPTILSFTLTRQDTERATQSFTFTNPPDFDVLEMSHVNPQVSDEVFNLLDKITVEREKYNNLKETFSGDSEEKDKFMKEIAEYITSFLIKIVNENLWSPGSQDKFVKKILRDAFEFAYRRFQNEGNPSENTPDVDASTATTVEQGMVDQHASPSQSSADKPEKIEVLEPANQDDEGSTVRDVDMENAVHWVNSRNPRKASEFRRKI